MNEVDFKAIQTAQVPDLCRLEKLASRLAKQTGSDELSILCQLIAKYGKAMRKRAIARLRIDTPVF